MLKRKEDVFEKEQEICEAAKRMCLKRTGDTLSSKEDVFERTRDILTRKEDVLKKEKR